MIDKHYVEKREGGYYLSQTRISLASVVYAYLDGHSAEGIQECHPLPTNGDAHLKSGIVGPSETIPVVDGRLGLSRWQNLFFCEFDGPRSDRRVLCTLIADRD